mmetsp:Transcript_18330/g.1613  ORF Transcript_18330/g.1613 Transcript_18330/m.1613 type:complete len:109 (-) Transcript_18330:160-486(-)
MKLIIIPFSIIYHTTSIFHFTSTLFNSINPFTSIAISIRISILCLTTLRHSWFLKLSLNSPHSSTYSLLCLLSHTRLLLLFLLHFCSFHIRYKFHFYSNISHLVSFKK